MRLTFSGKSVPTTGGQREYAARRLQRLGRYFNSAREAHLSHSVQRGFDIVEVQLDLDGVVLRAEARAQDYTSSVDLVAEKLEQQVRRLKEKLKSHKGRADAPTVAGVMTELAPEEEPVSAEPMPAVVRRKRFAIKPMSVDEASLQMELVNHDFFAFLSADTGQVNILYRRRDGNYGLLELEA